VLLMSLWERLCEEICKYAEDVYGCLNGCADAAEDCDDDEECLSDFFSERVGRGVKVSFDEARGWVVVVQDD